MQTGGGGRVPMHAAHSPSPTVRRARSLALLGLCAVLPGLAGCARAQLTENRLGDNILLTDADGHVDDLDGKLQTNTEIDDGTGMRRTGEDLARAQARRMVNAALIWAEKSNNDKVRIVIFIHGGLNTRDDAIERVNKTAQQIMGWQGEERAFPMFVSWPSDLASCYGQSLLSVRGGRKTSKVYTVPSLPVVAATNVATSVVNMPLNIVNQIKVSDWPSLTHSQPRDGWSGEPSGPDGVAKWDVYRGTFDSTFGTQAGAVSAWILTLPFKLTVFALGTDAGRRGWEMMLRRTQTMFRLPEEACDSPGQDMEPPRIGAAKQPSGAFAILLGEIQRQYQLYVDDHRHGKNPDFQIILVGHSMGTIILNQALTFFPDLPVKDVVYAAAACSVHDAEMSVIPFLQAKRRKARTAFLFDVYDQWKSSLSKGFKPSSGSSPVVTAQLLDLRSNPPSAVDDPARYDPLLGQSDFCRVFTDRLGEILSGSRVPKEDGAGDARGGKLNGVEIGSLANQINIECDAGRLSNAQVAVAAAQCLRGTDLYSDDFRSEQLLTALNNKCVNFYNLSLHPLAEVSETNYGDLVPRGSLLMWIDTFLQSPATAYERTMGTWDNAMATIAVWRSVPDLVHFKCFDARFNYLPWKHGEIAQGPFWTREWYAPTSQMHFFRPIDEK